MLQAELWTDGELAPDDFERATADLLRDGGPWGQGWPEPLFDGRSTCLARSRRTPPPLELATTAGPNAIHFGGWDGAEPSWRARIAYRLRRATGAAAMRCNWWSNTAKRPESLNRRTCQRRAVMRRHVVGLVAPDLVPRLVRRGMVGHVPSSRSRRYAP